MGRATCTGEISSIIWLVRLQYAFFVSYLLWQGLVSPAVVGKAFWNSGSGRKAILLRSRSFALELGKVGYYRMCTAHSRCRSGGRALFQHNNVVKQSTIKA